MLTYLFRSYAFLSLCCLLAVHSPLLAGSSMSVTEQAKLPKLNLVEVAAGAGQFKTLLTAAGAADLIDTLRAKGPVTIFAPTDAAFAKLPKQVVADLLKPENKAKLTAILTYHVVPGRVNADQAVKLNSAKTVNGKTLKLNVSAGSLFINDAKVIQADVFASNGTIHVIDSVLLPPEKKLSTTEKLIKEAIGYGAPQFNMGNRQACAEIYAITAMALIHMDIPAEYKTILKKAKAQASAQHHSGSKAWTYRRAFDAILNKQQKEEVAMTSGT